MSDLHIYGASGHSKVIIEIAECLDYQIAGIVDDNPSIKSLLGYTVNGQTNTTKDDRWIIGIGNNSIRKKIVSTNSLHYVSLIHPAVTISSRSLIAEGTVVMAGVTINTEAKIGKHCIINTNAAVDHDCIIEDYVHLSPNVALAGNVTIGEGTHVGIGACIIQGITIGKWCTVGAGTVVIRDIPDGATVVGNPGKVIKQKEFPE